MSYLVCLAEVCLAVTSSSSFCIVLKMLEVHKLICVDMSFNYERIARAEGSAAGETWALGLGCGSQLCPDNGDDSVTLTVSVEALKVRMFLD